jgi:hypothetical protein
LTCAADGPKYRRDAGAPTIQPLSSVFFQATQVPPDVVCPGISAARVTEPLRVMPMRSSSP